MTQHERRVRVALAGEVCELRAEHPPAVFGQAAIALGQRIVERARGELVQLAVEDGLEARGAAAGANELRELHGLDGARAIELRDVDGAEAEGRDHRDLLELVRVVEALLPRVQLQDRLVLGAPGRLFTLVQRRADAAAHRVLVVERPPVEEIDVVAAVHPRAGPHGELVVGALRVEVADADGLVGLARKVEERREQRQRRDDAALHALAPLVLAAELELGVAALVDDARSERNDVGAATGAAAQIACSIHASVGAELEGALVVGGLLGDDARGLVASREARRRRAGDRRAARVRGDRRIRARGVADGRRGRSGGRHHDDGGGRRGRKRLLLRERRRRQRKHCHRRCEHRSRAAAARERHDTVS